MMQRLSLSNNIKIVFWAMLLISAGLSGAYYATLRLPLLYITLLQVIVCAITDYYTYSKGKDGVIYNVIVAPALPFALAYHFISAGTPGLWLFTKGLLVAGSLAFVMYWFCAIGGGDFKLIVALGALHGGPFTGLCVMIASVLMLIYGIFLMTKDGKLKEFLRSLCTTTKYILARMSAGGKDKIELGELPGITVPFGVPLAMAVVIVFTAGLKWGAF